MRDEGCPNVYHGEDRVQTAIAAKVYWRGVRASFKIVAPLTGTEGSNPASSSGESRANLKTTSTFRGGVARPSLSDRLIWYFIPHALTNIPGDVSWQAYSTIIYLSFVTLTLFD
jgi:hypothetical protein